MIKLGPREVLDYATKPWYGFGAGMIVGMGVGVAKPELGALGGALQYGLTFGLISLVSRAVVKHKTYTFKPFVEKYISA